MNQKAAEEKQKVMFPKLCSALVNILPASFIGKNFAGNLKTILSIFFFHIQALMHKLSWKWNLDIEPNSDPPGLRWVPESRLDWNSVRSERRWEKQQSNVSESVMHPVHVVSFLAQGVHLIARQGSDTVRPVGPMEASGHSDFWRAGFPAGWLCREGRAPWPIASEKPTVPWLYQ